MGFIFFFIFATPIWVDTGHSRLLIDLIFFNNWRNYDWIPFKSQQSDQKQLSCSFGKSSFKFIPNIRKITNSLEKDFRFQFWNCFMN